MSSLTWIDCNILHILLNVLLSQKNGGVLEQLIANEK